MKKLYIHIGFGKCGSSSIQTFLSRCEKFTCKNNDELIYAALIGNQRLIFGNELTQLASSSNNGYRASLPFAKMPVPANDYFEAVGDQLLALLQKKHVVLSQESWANHAQIWKEMSFFSDNKIDVTLILYLRPPVTWINSAWWQWGAWQNHHFDDWVKHAIHNVQFSSTVLSFKNLSTVNSVRVRLLGSDLLDDFSKILGLDKKLQLQTQAVSNKSLPNGILRLFQKHRRLRPEPHSSAIDFVLEKYLQLEGKADWLLSHEQIKHIIEQTRASNVQLIDLIDVDCKEKFISDPRYWDTSAFDAMVCKSSTGVNPTYEELEQIAVAGIDAVMQLAKQQEKIKIKSNLSFDQFSLWRDLALQVENSDIELAYQLMKQAYKLNPNGQIIQRKLALYQKELTNKN